MRVEVQRLQFVFKYCHQSGRKYHNILLTQGTCQAEPLSQNTKRSEIKILNGQEKSGNLGEGQAGRGKSHFDAPEELSHPLTETCYSRSYLGELHCGHTVNIIITEPILWMSVSHEWKESSSFQVRQVQWETTNLGIRKVKFSFQYCYKLHVTLNKLINLFSYEYGKEITPFNKDSGKWSPVASRKT